MVELKAKTFVFFLSCAASETDVKAGEQRSQKANSLASTRGAHVQF